MATLTFIHDAADAADHTAALKALRDPAAGRYVVAITPHAAQDAGNEGFLKDILFSLGKRYEVPGHPASRYDVLQWTTAWLLALKVQTLIVTRAAMTPTNTWARLAELCACWDIDLWLVYQASGIPRRVKTVLDDWGFVRTDWDGLQALPVSTPELAVEDAPQFPVVPWSELPDFADHCRRRCSPSDWAQIRAAMQTGAAAFWSTSGDKDRKAATEKALVELLRSSRDVREALARMRGAQLAAFHERWYISVQPSTFEGRYAVEPTTHVDRHVAERLRWFWSPAYTAAAALTLGGLDNHQLAAVNVGDVPPLAAHPAVSGIATPFLAAQGWLRLQQGARPDDPLFTGKRSADNPYPRKSSTFIHVYLRNAEAATGLRLLPRQQRDSHWTPSRYLRLFGVKIEPLFTPAEEQRQNASDGRRQFHASGASSKLMSATIKRYAHGSAA